MRYGSIQGASNTLTLLLVVVVVTCLPGALEEWVPETVLSRGWGLLPKGTGGPWSGQWIGCLRNGSKGSGSVEVRTPARSVLTSAVWHMVRAEHFCWTNEHRGLCCRDAGRIPGVTGRKEPTARCGSAVKTCSKADSGSWSLVHPRSCSAPSSPLPPECTLWLHTGCPVGIQRRDEINKMVHSLGMQCRREGSHEIVDYPHCVFIIAVISSVSGWKGVTWAALVQSPVGRFPPPCPLCATSLWRRTRSFCLNFELTCFSCSPITYIWLIYALKLLPIYVSYLLFFQLSWVLYVFLRNPRWC